MFRFNKTALRSLFTIIIFSISSFSALALTFSSEFKNTVQQNSIPKLISALTIQENDTPLIKASTPLQITIPPALTMIFDTSLTKENFKISGTAAQTGKIDPDQISFTNRDRTISLTVLEDFQANDTLILRGIYTRGFHLYNTESAGFILQSGDHTISDAEEFVINISNLTDFTSPQEPTNILITQNPEGGVTLTWEDPTDLDINRIQILRGLNGNVNGIPFEEVQGGTQQFIDLEPKPNDTVIYRLRATDGLNFSSLTPETTLTLLPPEEPTPEPEPIPEPQPEDPEIICTMEYAPVCGIDGKTYSNTCFAQKTEIAHQGECSPPQPQSPLEQTSLLDISDHWAKDIIIQMTQKQIIKGNPDGTFKPDSPLNRAEAATLIYRLIWGNQPLTAPQIKPFTDTPTAAWYTGHLSKLKTADIIKGNPDGTYKPTSNINRAEFLTLALNAYHNQATIEQKTQLETYKAQPKTTAYTDLQDSWYTQTVTAATKLQIIEGLDCQEDQKCFRAEQNITRAEAVKILHLLFN